MTVARNLLLPAYSNTFRTVYLYVGQGDSTLHIIPDGAGGFRYVLVDINRNAACGGLDVVRLLEDLLPRGADGKPALDVFLNTHPHNDHLCGVDHLADRITVGEVWHTGFTPSDRHATAFANLTRLIRQVERRGGRVWEYRGTRETAMFGAVWYNVLSPADHTKEEIDALTGKERDCRIHDYCGVFRFGYGAAHQRKHVLDTGDADKVAWSEYILGPTEYHRERVSATVLNAAHHGSRSFFMLDENDPNPYRRHMELIGPTWVVISSPCRADSQHGHPHPEAIRLYEEFVAPQNIRILGERPECLIYDVYDTGGDSLASDDGRLIDAYALDGEDGDGGNGGARSWLSGAPAIISQVDRGRPMGSAGA